MFKIRYVTVFPISVESGRLAEVHQVPDQPEDEPESVELVRRDGEGAVDVDLQCEEGVPSRLPLLLLPVLRQHLVAMDPGQFRARR